MAADIVGYSALMAENEAATLRLRSDIRGLIEGSVKAASGRLFALAGDGFLAEFESPVEGVRAAHEIQAELALRRTQDPSYPQLRIGMHLADVVPDGEDLLGDGINIAVRIEGVAEPGSVTVSQQILDQVKRASRLAFRDMGEWTLKNIPDPLRLFRVVGELDNHSYSSSVKARPREPLRRGQPTLLVMPFANLSGEPSQDYFVDGFAEDLVTELARFKALFVIARNATLAYRGGAVEPAAAARDLGATHCVVGSLRRLGDRIRIAVQLLRMPVGEAIWAEKFDCAPDDIFEVQDRLASRIAAAVVGQVESDAAQTAKRKPPADLGAYDCLLRGLEFHRLGGVTPQDAEQAFSWFERAIQRDPDYGRAHAWRACALATLRDWTGQPWLEDCLASARTALELDPNEAEVHRIMGSISIASGDLAKALAHFKRGIEINPNHAYIAAKTAEIYNCLGQPELALEMIARAKDIDPFVAEASLEDEPRAYYLLGRYADAVRAVSVFERPTRRAIAYVVASNVRLGAEEETRRAVTALRRLDPGFAISSFLAAERFKDPALSERLAADLRAAGLPD